MLTLFFVITLILVTSLRLWLSMRHIRHIHAHRAQVPSAFAEKITLADHQKAADYTVAKVRVGIVDILLDACVLAVLTWGGLLNQLDAAAREWLGTGYLHGLGLFAGLAVFSTLIGLPLSWYRTFVIETRFGFNKMTLRLWLLDGAKEALLGAAIGAPLLLAVLWLMDSMGSYWWFYVWVVWLGFNLLMLLLYPTFIAPLFNTFSPLQDASLQARIESLLQRCGFSASGLFVMDGSRRSAHGNAYFTGFGRSKRIVFFDTLLERLAPSEIEAVLAHELGHYHHRHVIKRIVTMAALSLGVLWGLGYLLNQPAFFTALGVTQGGTAMGLLLFSLIVPLFLFPLAPLSAGISRQHEFEADAYAARQTSGADLSNALVKLYRDNAATLTPDPLHSLFHDSHPAAAARIARLQQA